MRPPARLAAALLTLAVTAGGCALPGAEGDDAAPTPVRLDFEFQRLGPDGYIDQTLTITNSGQTAGAPTLEITPLDDAGTPIAGVKVQTAFGSDEGQMVVPGRASVFDIVRFKGEGAADVADVRVEVLDAGELDDDVPAAVDLEPVRLDRKDRVTDSGRIHGLELTNPYDAAVTVRVTGVEYQIEFPDQPTQFRRLGELAEPTTIDPGETVTLEVPRKLRKRFFGTIQAYLSR